MIAIGLRTWFRRLQVDDQIDLNESIEQTNNNFAGPLLTVNGSNKSLRKLQWRQQQFYKQMNPSLFIMLNVYIIG